MSIGVPVFNTDVRIVTDAGLDAGPREIGELLIARAADRPGLLAEAGGDGGVAARRRAAHRRRRLHGRAGLVLPGRSRQGHDRGVGLQGVAARSRGGAVPASGGARGGGHRHPRPVSRRDHQGGHQPEAGHEVDRGRDQGVRARADGGLQVPARRRDRRRAAEDDERQDHAPAAADHDARRPRRCAAPSSAAGVVSAAARGRRGARRAGGRRRLAATQSRCRSRGRRPKASTSGCGRCSASWTRPAASSTATRSWRANEAYHAAVIGLAENEHLSQGFRPAAAARAAGVGAARTRRRTPENVVSAARAADRLDCRRATRRAR